MAVLRNEFTKLMQKDMYGYYLERYDQYQPVYPLLFDVQQSNSAFEKSTTAIGMGKLSERPEGQSIVYSNPLEGYEVIIRNRTFSDGFTLSMEFVEDTPPEKMANIIKEFAGTWADGVMATKEKFASDLFNKGGLTAGDPIFNNSITGVITDPSGNLVYDGKPFFNLSGNNRAAKAHSVTYYNGLALALSADNLQTAYTLMTTVNNRDEKGEIINIQPNVLLIPPTLKFTAKSILESDLLITGINGTLPNKNPVSGLLQIVEWQYLTDTGAWFIGAAKKGLVFYERKSPVIDFYQDEDTKTYKATIDTRFGAGVTNWRYWVGSNFITS